MVDICSLTILYTEQLPQHDYIQLKLSDQKIRTFQLMIDVWFVGIYLNKWFPSKFKFDFLLNNKKALRFCCKCLFFKKCDRNYKKPFIIQYTLKKSVCRHCQHHHINISSQSLVKYLKCVTVKLLQKKGDIIFVLVCFLAFNYLILLQRLLYIFTRHIKTMKFYK